MEIKMTFYAYQLNPIAKEGESLNHAFQMLKHMKTVQKAAREAEKILIHLLNEVVRGTQDNAEMGIYLIDCGLRHMFKIMQTNEPLAGSPRDASERKKFYFDLANGFKVLAEVMKEGYDAGRLDRGNVFACLQTIGHGGLACSSRWRCTLEELTRGFSGEIQNKNPNVVFENDPLGTTLKEIFSSARSIETNREAKAILNQYYRKESSNNKIHIESYLKRYINQKMSYNLPLIMGEDSFVDSIQQEVNQNADTFIKEELLDERVVHTAAKLFQEKVRENSDLYNRVVEHFSGLFHKNKLEASYDDVTEYLIDEIFEGYSKNLRERSVYQIFQERDFIQKKLSPQKMEKEIKCFLQEDDDKGLLNFICSCEQERPLKEALKGIVDTQVMFGETPLIIAAKKNNKILMQKLLLLKADINKRDWEGFTALHHIVERGYKDGAEWLLEKGAKVHLESNYGDTALNIAVRLHDYSLVRMLIKHNANPNEINTKGMSPLHIAAEAGRIEVLKELLRQGAQMDLQNHIGETPLYVAAMNNQKQACRFLLETGIKMELRGFGGNTGYHIMAMNGDVEFFKSMRFDKKVLEEKNNDGYTPLFCAAVKKHHALSVHLINKGADVDVVNKNGQSLFHQFVMNGWIDIMENCISKGVNLAHRDKYGYNVVHYGVFSGSKTVLEKSLTLNQDINAVSHKNDTPLHSAVIRGNMDTTRILLANNANPDVVNHQERTPLIEAIAQNHFKLAQLLLHNGANPNVTIEKNLEKLAMTIRKPNDALLELLLKHHLNPNIKDRTGRSMLHYAVKAGNEKMTSLLIRYRADVNIVDNFGKTPLIEAIKLRKIEITKRILESNANPNTLEQSGMSPLYLAVEEQNCEKVRLLLRYGADPNYGNRKEYRPLHIAIKKNQSEICKVLIDAGSCLNDTDHKNRTPYKLAKKQNNPEICTILKTAEMEQLNKTINRRNTNQTTCLMSCFRSHALE